MTSDAPLIERLHGLRLPPPIAVDAPDPWLILGVGVMTLAVATIFVFIAWHALRLPMHRREARTLIAAADALEPSSQLTVFAQVLRRIALAEQAPHEILIATDARWLAWLDAHFSTDYFVRGEGRIFGDALYQNAVPDNVSEIGSALHRLLKQRRRDASAR
jgi:hypothetical protein